ncbi:hypothetical protein C8J38_1011198 [Rhizobium sp. PP-WC-2G-219]|nr:hypothetical protein C8J38_1011198 [Rhizobium sp. PP-WC-2G-219]
MPHGMNNDLGLGDLVENQVGIGQRDQTTNRGILRTGAGERLILKLLDQGLDTLHDPTRTLR